MKRGSGLAILSVLVISILLVSSVSAFSLNDFSNFFKNFWQKITGKATENLPPVATLSATPLSGEAPLTVSFAITCSDPDTDPGNYLAICSIEYGDNSAAPYISEGGKPVSKTTHHTYSSVGTYTAILKAVDYKMLETKKEITITVSKAATQPTTSTPSPTASPTPSTTQVTCTDSDGKDNFDVAGEVTCSDGNTHKDFCKGSFAHDYYFSGGKVSYTRIDCTTLNRLCENGACKKQEIAYWKFDEAQSNVAKDSADANDGSVKGANWQSSCISGSCLAFDGKSSYVEVPHSANLNVNNELSIVAWVNVKGNQGTYRSVIMKREGGGSVPLKGWMLYAGTDNKWQFWLGKSNAWAKVITDADVELDKWTHVAASYSTGKMFIYVNGELRGSADVTGAVLNSNAKLAIGAGIPVATPTSFFKGLIDEVKVYGKALTSDEIKKNYEELKPVEGYLQVATIKDTYNIGEKVELTDPPEEVVSEDIQLANNEGSYTPSEFIIDNSLSEDISSMSQPSERYSTIENQVYDRIKKQTEIPKEVQERVAKLDSVVVSELASLRETKSKEKKELKKYEEAYAETEIKGINKINPFAYIKRSQAKSAVKLQQAKAEEADSNLKAKLDKYGIPIEVDKELDEIEELATTWTPNYNMISIQTDEYKKKLLGLKLSEEEAKKLSAEETEISPSITTETDSSLPDFFDWRDIHGMDYTTPVKDQGACGSCWAFASVAALEGAVNAYFNNPNLDADLSEQDLITCYQEDGCDGANEYEIKELFSTYLKETGVSKEECFVYEACDGIESEYDIDYCTYTINCDKKCSDWQADAWKIVSYKAPELTRETIKKTIMENGPVEVGMAVYEDFFYYQDGIYSHAWGGLAGYHAITIVGWGVYDGMGYWIVKNSWSTDWAGEGGYFRIAMGDSEIDSWFAFAVEQPVAPYDEKRICQDKDNDGYCNWGIGEKPSTCPSICKEIKDCDDSDSSIFEGCGANPEKTGFLTVTSEPGEAEVYVVYKDPEDPMYEDPLYSGEIIYRGKTPLTIELNVGEREINIIKKDYLDYNEKINIQEGQKTEISIILTPAPKLIHPLNNDIFRLGDVTEINGTARGSGFESYSVEYGEGENPKEWYTDGITLVNGGKEQITEDKLATWDTSRIKEGGYYTIKLTTNYDSGITREKFIRKIHLDPTLKKGWPVKIEAEKYYCDDGYIISACDDEDSKGDTIWPGSLEPNVADLNNDGYKEIVVYKGGIPPKLYILDYKGNTITNNPIEVRKGEDRDDTMLQFPVIGDVNKDGYNEIVILRPKNWKEVPNQGLIYPEILIYDYRGIILDSFIVDEVFKYGAGLALADLNNDGYLEIIMTGTTKITVLDYKGNTLNGWPKMIPDWCFPFEDYNTPATANLDDDEDLEIILAWAGKNEGIIRVYNPDGTELWTIETKGRISNSPTTGDINNDSEPEIITGSEYGIFVYDKYGNVLKGWPRLTSHNVFGSPSLGDFNGDNKLEIVVSGQNLEEDVFQTYMFNSDGSIVGGWPKETCGWAVKSEVIGDINGDGIPEVITNTARYGRGSCYEIYAWDYYGNLIEGFPKRPWAGMNAPVILSDIDNDDYIELIATSGYRFSGEGEYGYTMKGEIYVWELDAPYNPFAMHWPMFMHDPAMTGRYVKPEPQKPKSLINNTGTKTISGRLIIKVEKKAGSGLTQIKTIVDKQVSVAADSYLALDKEWQAAGYFTPAEAGTYRIYAALLNSAGEIIQTSLGKLESSYEFSVF